MFGTRHFHDSKFPWKAHKSPRKTYTKTKPNPHPPARERRQEGLPLLRHQHHPGRQAERRGPFREGRQDLRRPGLLPRGPRRDGGAHRAGDDQGGADQRHPLREGGAVAAGAGAGRGWNIEVGFGVCYFASHLAWASPATLLVRGGGSKGLIEPPYERCRRCPICILGARGKKIGYDSLLQMPL